MEKTPHYHLAQEQEHGSEEMAIIHLTFFVPIYRNQNRFLSRIRMGEKKLKIKNYGTQSVEGTCLIFPPRANHISVPAGDGLEKISCKLKKPHPAIMFCPLKAMCGSCPGQ